MTEVRLNKNGDRRGMHGNQRQNVQPNHPWKVGSFGKLEHSLASGFVPGKPRKPANHRVSTAPAA